VFEWNDLYLVETWKCWNGISSRTEHALCCFKEWLCPSVDGQHRVKQPINSISAHITSHQINPSWLGQNGGWRCWSTACTVCVCVCVCAQNVKMSNIPRDRPLSWETALSTIFFLIMHLTICSDRAFHFCVPNMMGFHNMAPEGLKEGVVLSLSQCLRGVWVRGLRACVCPRGVLFLYVFLFISHFLTTHYLLLLHLSVLRLSFNYLWIDRFWILLTH